MSETLANIPDQQISTGTTVVDVPKYLWVFCRVVIPVRNPGAVWEKLQSHQQLNPCLSPFSPQLSDVSLYHSPRLAAGLAQSAIFFKKLCSMHTEFIIINFV
jgi:hypothetical protein